MRQSSSGGPGSAVAPQPDALGDEVAAPAVALVRQWLAAAEATLTRKERRDRRRFQLLTGDARSVAFTMAFCDRVLRPESDTAAADELRAVARPPLPRFLSPADRLLLRAGAALGPLLPGVVLPLARRRLRRIVGGLVADREDRALTRHLRTLRSAGYRVNANLLGEHVLGDGEAAHRLAATIELLARDDVSYVSVKASTVASQLNLWAYDDTLERVKRGLRELYRAAGTKFVNLDMEEHADLRLTVDAFRQLLDEPELRGIDAGIVLQAYLPDSVEVLAELVEWAGARHDAGGGTIKIRIVKGANLAMERVDAAMHGWAQAPYATKADTDANYKRLLDWALDRERLRAVRIGVASHNLFDVAWALSLAERRGVADRVELEMLQGMAVGIDRTVLAATGSLLLYTPVVAAADFDTALAYLFRRLEENSGGENFLRSMFDLGTDEAAFDVERARFEAAVAARWTVGAVPRRLGETRPPADGFRNEPDTDPTDVDARRRIVDAVRRGPGTPLPPEVTDPHAVDRIVAAARAAAPAWRDRSPADRRDVLRRVGDELAARRAELLAVMAHEAHKTVAEGDGEVSEAVDFARYYAEHAPGLRGDLAARFEPLGVVAVVPPWNFPLAIPAGGTLAALAAGNTVILKAAPQTPRCAAALAEACRAAGVPADALQLLRCPDEVVGERLITSPGIDGVILTGAAETAELFTRLAPGTPLFAETSGKNTIVVLPDADLDLAAADLVRSAFGHGGQKCSAASLGVLVGDVYRSARFRRQLVDAARSMAVGPATEPASVVAPLIGPPGDDLRRALTSLDAGERWLLEPRLVDPDRHLWSPGIKDGVAPGSWFHRTECFGPVLGLAAAADLDEAIAFQNGTAFGLTGGLHTLDPAEVERWLERVEVGNAYVNRAITGAIVQRQPFGGWKRSVVGPGAKAGGPNYVAQLGRWTDAEGPVPNDAEVAAALLQDHDPTGLFCESNVLRYRPFRRLVVRVERDARPEDVARVRRAIDALGLTAELGDSTDADRIRVVGTSTLPALGPWPYVDDRPVVGDGRIELLRYVREQAVSRTRHRFGNLT